MERVAHVRIEMVFSSRVPLINELGDPENCQHHDRLKDDDIAIRASRLAQTIHMLAIKHAQTHRRTYTRSLT